MHITYNGLVFFFGFFFLGGGDGWSFVEMIKQHLAAETTEHFGEGRPKHVPYACTTWCHDKSIHGTR